MQLMPGTADNMGVDDIYDIYDNIRGGVKYFKQCLIKTKNDVPLALAAYNAGIGNVSKYNGIPPFKETQNYVDKINIRHNLIHQPFLLSNNIRRIGNFAGNKETNHIQNKCETDCDFTNG